MVNICRHFTEEADLSGKFFPCSSSKCAVGLSRVSPALRSQQEMSVSMSKAEGVTVFTVTSDPKSSLPPICQILKSLCYSPVCCTVSGSLRRVQGTSQSTLGALQIMVGLLNLAFGAIMICSRGGFSWQMEASLFPFWLGGLFILFGIFSILSERCPSPCLVTITLILNLCGVAFAIVAVVLYSINIANVRFWWLCNDNYWGYRSHVENQATTPPSWLMENCHEGKALLIMVLQAINAVLIILSALQLCLSISSSVLGIKALKKRQSLEEKADFDPEIYNPLLEGSDDATS